MTTVEFDLPESYTLGDWALVLQCLDEDGDDRLVLRYSDSISGVMQYALLGQGFDAVRADQANRWESS